MTKSQIKEVTRVCGKWFQWYDIPALWRKERTDKARAEDSIAEDQREKDKFQRRCWACGAVRENKIQCESCGAGTEKTDPWAKIN